MKLVFLDVDGVLNSFDSWHAKRADGFSFHCAAALDPTLVARLNTLLSRAPADTRVILSSTWRKRLTPEEMKAILVEVCPGFCGNLVDRTPVLWRDVDGNRLYRGDEIQVWLDEHGHEATGMVILDDDSDMAHLGDWLIKTECEDGLQDRHVEAALALLERPMPRMKPRDCPTCHGTGFSGTQGQGYDDVCDDCGGTRVEAP